MNPSIESATVLLIDHDPDTLARILDTLHNEGIELVTARNGRDGLRIATRVHPELILLEGALPDMDGLEICGLLQAHPQTRLIPVIFLTERNRAEDKISGLSLGAVDYVTKPFDPRELGLRVSNHLRLARTAQAAATATQTDDTASPRARVTADRALDLLQRARDHLEAHLTSPPDLPHLARHIGTNRTTLQQLFQTHLGLSIFAYLREQRLQRARHLIDDGADRVDLIASQVGYANGRDLSRAFKQRFGLTPSAYARSARESTE